MRERPLYAGSRTDCGVQPGDGCPKWGTAERQGQKGEPATTGFPAASRMLGMRRETQLP